MLQAKLYYIWKMNRTTSNNAIVLSLKTLGENNFSVTILTREQGVIFGTLYGGPKSKLRSLVSQWNAGVIYLYENQEKNQIKISDFDVKKFHDSFSENLFKSFASSLAAEIVIKTRCGGSNQQVFDLVSGFFDGMELSDEAQSRVGLIRFLWRYLEILGVQPDSSSCSFCGKSFLSEFAPDSNSYYNVGANSFICRECYNKDEIVYPLSTLGAVYLTGLTNLQPAEARKLKIDKETYQQIKQIVFYLIEKNIETKLNTLETGRGIL